MGMDALWSFGLTACLAFIVWWIKSQHDELKRVQILLNKTREDLPREFVSKTDSSAVMAQIVNRFDRLEEKIDRLMNK